MNKSNKNIIDYYQNLESRLGYTFLTWNAKHFGYYPDPTIDIGEKHAQEAMQDLLANNLRLKKGDIILDAGSGRGVVATYLAKKYNVSIEGIDLVPFEVAIAKKRAVNMTLVDKVHFSIQDYSHTKFPDRQFDAIYTMETLVHSPNIHKTLKEFYRVLKPGGGIALFEYSISPFDKFLSREKKMFDVIINGSAMTSLPTMYHNVVAEYIRDAGFTDVKAQDITKHIEPSMYRFYRYAKYPYKLLIKPFSLQKYFINITTGVEFYNIGKRGLVRYRIFTARKT